MRHALSASVLLLALGSCTDEDAAGPPGGGVRRRTAATPRGDRAPSSSAPSPTSWKPLAPPRERISHPHRKSDGHCPSGAFRGRRLRARGRHPDRTHQRGRDGAPRRGRGQRGGCRTQYKPPEGPPRVQQRAGLGRGRGASAAGGGDGTPPSHRRAAGRSPRSRTVHRAPGLSPSERRDAHHARHGDHHAGRHRHRQAGFPHPGGAPGRVAPRPPAAGAQRGLSRPQLRRRRGDHRLAGEPRYSRSAGAWPHRQRGAAAAPRHADDRAARHGQPGCADGARYGALAARSRSLRLHRVRGPPGHPDRHRSRRPTRRLGGSAVRTAGRRAGGRRGRHQGARRRPRCGWPNATTPAPLHQPAAGRPDKRKETDHVAVRHLGETARVRHGHQPGAGGVRHPVVPGPARCASIPTSRRRWCPSAPPTQARRRVSSSRASPG